MTPTRRRRKRSPFQRFIRRYGKLILAGLVFIAVVVAVILIVSNCSKKKSSEPKNGGTVSESQTAVPQDANAGGVPAGEGIPAGEVPAGEGAPVAELIEVNGFSHVPELQPEGWYVHGGNEREPEWFHLKNQEGAALNTYESRFWSVDGNGIYTYTDPAYTSTMGVDLSGYTGEVDWNQMAQFGVKFAIIRVGYRGYGTGALVEDEMARANVQAATDAGIQVGLYFVSQAISDAEAVEEAQFCLNIASEFNVTMPIYYDMEEVLNDVARTDNLDQAQYTSNAVNFCNTIEAAGRRAGIYANQVWFTEKLDLVQVENFDIWFAKYTGLPDYPYKFDMWQYSETGTVPGVNGPIDLNVRMVRN